MPGRCYRRDTPDARHIPTFNQIEGLVVDRGISFADLAGTIETFTTAYFGPDIHSRLRPVVLPLHRAVGRVRDHLHHLRGCRLPDLLAHGMDRARGLRDGRPGRVRGRGTRRRGCGRASPSASGSTAAPRCATRSPTCGSCSRTTSACCSRSEEPVLVPLSWLRDFAPFEGDAAVSGRDPRRSRAGGRGCRSTSGQGLEDVVVARVLEINAIAGADKIRQVMVDAGDGEPRRGRVRGLELRRRGSRPPGPRRRGASRRLRHRQAQDERGDLERDAVLGARARVDRRPRGHPGPGRARRDPRDRHRTSLVDALGIETDVVFDIAVEANRPDAWSHGRGGPRPGRPPPSFPSPCPIRPRPAPG